MVPDEVTSKTTASYPKIPGYKLKGVLGRGATGVVYRAVQLAIDRPVAIKILHPELVGTKRAVRRLQREARTAARLAHPNIISAIDMGEVNGQWWYAMELVVGVPLSKRLEHGTLSEREALRLFAPLADALEHAYEQGVVHRDIKPANILIDAHGRARIVDLGLAFAEDDPMLTKAGGTLGTPHYISPEQARDPSTVDTRSDIWSLGATMYQSLCGRPPFEGDSVAEILSSVLYRRVPDPRLLSPQLSRGMALVLRKCLTRDADRRYQQPLELMKDLERLRERRAPRVRASALDPVDSGRPEWLVPAVATAAALLLGATGLWYFEPWVDDAGGQGLVEGPLPELAAVREDFESGTILHRAALLDLDRMDVPERFDVPRSQLRTDVLSDLDARLVAFRASIEAEFLELLENHAFEQASVLIEQALQDKLRQRTGFTVPESLPEGRRRDGYRTWRESLATRLAERRELAVQRADARLAAHYADVIVPRFEELRAANQWKDALAWIGAAELPAHWLTDGEVDVRGLSRDERRLVVRSIDALRREGRTELRRSWETLNGGLVRWVRQTRETLLGQLEAIEVRDAATKLATAFEAELRSLDVDREQIPRDWSRGAFTRFDEAREELQAREDELVAEYARDSFADDAEIARALCRRRAYDEASELWKERLADPLLATMHSAIRLRVEECSMLAAFLQRAADGVTKRANQEFELYVGSIPTKGKLLPGIDPLERGFELRTLRSNRVVSQRFYLQAAAAEQDKEGRLCQTDAIEELAGLPLTGLSAQDRLIKALFRYYEGDYRRANEALPIGELPDNELLADLSDRIQAALQARDSARMARELSFEKRYRSLKQGLKLPQRVSSPERFLAEIAEIRTDFDDLLQAQPKRRQELRGWERELRKLLEARPAPEAFESAYGADVLQLDSLGRVTMIYRFTGADVGTWSRGDWVFEGDGWELVKTVDGDETLLGGNSPRLELVDPLDVTKRLLVRFRFEPLQSAIAGNNTLLVSVAGFHAVFQDEPGSPRFLMDTTSAADVLERLRAGKNKGFPDFVPFDPTEPLTIELDVSAQAGKLYSMRVNGEEVDGRHQFASPAGDEFELSVRSVQPINLIEVVIDGRVK